MLDHGYTAEMLMKFQEQELQRINREAWMWVVPKSPRVRISTRISEWFRSRTVAADPCCAGCC